MSAPLTRYSCEETFRRLDDFLDRELTTAETELVNDHLLVCAACAREFRFEASVLAGVRRSVQRIALPDGLQARVLAALRALDGEEPA